MIAVQAGMSLAAFLFGAATLAAVADHGPGSLRWWRRLVLLHRRRMAKVHQLAVSPPRCLARPGCTGTPTHVVLTDRRDTVPACSSCADHPTVTVLWALGPGGRWRYISGGAR